MSDGMSNLAALLHQAVDLHRAGRLDEALGLYRQVLAQAPGQPDALSLEATVHWQQGRLDQAAAGFRAALDARPDNPDALNNYGNVLRDHGRSEDALELFRRAVALRPSFAEAHNNIGNALRERGDLAAAEAAYREAIAAQPAYLPAQLHLGHVLRAAGRLDEALACYQSVAERDGGRSVTLNTFGSALQEAGRYGEAEQAYRAALQRDPKLVAAHQNLGSLYQTLGRRDDAIACYERVIALDPEHLPALRNLGIVLQEAGRSAQAIEVFGRVLAHLPEDPVALHGLASARGETTARAPGDYLRTMFDAFAPHFETTLVDSLQYRAPEQIRAAVGRVLAAGDAGRRFARALDLGCGTGLVARQFADLTEAAEGIDLAPRMVAQARASGFYEAVFEGEILDYFAGPGRDSRFDLVLSADVFIYLGALEEIFTAVAAHLSDGGLFAFSVETAEEAEYVLRPTGRYAQSDAYIERLAAANGLTEVDREAVALRLENNRPVAGRVFVLARGS